jgi:predicted glycosyltransferase
VVTPGGGGDGLTLVRTVMEMLVAEQRDGHSTFHALVVTGPLMSKEDRLSLMHYADSHLPLTIVEFTTDMMSYLSAADIVVSMGGYNTVCEILSLRQRAVLVPRVRVRTEQLLRAENLAARHQVRIIHPSELTPNRLRGEIDVALASPRPNPGRAGIHMGGLDRISQACGELLGLVWPNPAQAASFPLPSERDR